MGNAATLPYDIAQQIDYNGSINWTLHEASKKVFCIVTKNPLRFY